MPGIEIRSITKVFPGGVTALDSLDLSIEDGEFFALLGPSGCGKTTLLRTIAGLETATSGQITIGERDVTPLAPGARNVAMVFQDYALYPHMTVRDNIAYPLKVKGMHRAQRAAEAESAGANLSLSQLMERRPGQLSGGQQQRVALARAIATRPDAFLFDEPLSNLDARLRLEARSFLKQLQRELGTTAVFVTHDQSEALALADRMAVMESGIIRQVGTPSELFHRPANVFVAGFIGSTPMNLIPGTVSGSGVEFDGGVFTVDEMPTGRHGRRLLRHPSGVREARPERPTAGHRRDHREPRRRVPRHGQCRRDADQSHRGRGFRTPARRSRGDQPDIPPGAPLRPRVRGAAVTVMR